MSRIDDLLAAEGDAAEHTPTPEDSVGGHRNVGRSVVFSIRLNPEEVDELQRLADGRGLPARTLARAWILEAMREDDNLSTRVARLERAVFARTG